MILTEEHIGYVMPRSPREMRGIYGDLLTQAMLEANIVTVLRAAMFLGQGAHESGELRYFEEIASGDAYEGRHDLGNTLPGDGRRYKGRGVFQITGRDNYQALGEYLGLDLLVDPDLVAQPAVGFRSAAWFWTSRDLNAKADAIDFRAVTLAINGGYTALDRRQAYYARALEVLARDSVALTA